MIPVESPNESTATPHTLEQCEKHVAQRRLWIGHNNVVAELDPGTAAGQQCGTIIQVVLAADVRAEHHARVVKQARAIGLLDRLEPVNQVCKSFGHAAVACAWLASMRGPGNSD